MNAFIHTLMLWEYSVKDENNDLSNNRNRNKRILQFFWFAVAMDIMLVMTEFVAGISPLTDIARHPWLYGYIFLVTVAAFSFFGAMVGSREDELEKLALRDSLTGLFNSRYLWARMDEQWATGRREKSVSSLVLFDLDFFKRVNDKYGHPVGDELLKRVGRILGNAARKGDTVARIGGEEFVFFLPDTSAIDAAAIAERIRNTISLTTLATDGQQQVKITISAGVSGTGDYIGTTPQALYSQADKALYLAKSQGRNKVVISDSSREKDHKELKIRA